MAFCGNCGTQLNDGAKFCPKCGKAVGGDASILQQQESKSQQIYEDQGETGLNIWMKIIIVLLWPLGLILGFIYKNKNKGIKAKDAFMYCTIGFGASMGMYLSNNLNECSSNSRQIETISSSRANDVAEEGYNDGYRMGFQIGHITSEPDAKIPFTAAYGAPSTREEKEMYNIYKENFERGYRDGTKAGRE